MKQKKHQPAVEAKDNKDLGAQELNVRGLA
jgi:hypothetical protein